MGIPYKKWKMKNNEVLPIVQELRGKVQGILDDGGDYIYIRLRCLLEGINSVTVVNQIIDEFNLQELGFERRVISKRQPFSLQSMFLIEDD